MSFDLDRLSREELKKLRAEIDKALQTLDSRRKAEALRAAEDAARQHGFSLQELQEMKGKSKSAPRYRNPADPDQTWTGRGRKPRWITEALDSGKKLSDMEI